MFVAAQLVKEAYVSESKHLLPSKDRLPQVSVPSRVNPLYKVTQKERTFFK
jgi:hypothetical protein